MSERKARTELAKYLAYSNAAEFIRQHGEEGHRYEDEKLQESYDKAKVRAANMLDKLADKHISKYHSLGIKIEANSDKYS